MQAVYGVLYAIKVAVRKRNTAQFLYNKEPTLQCRLDDVVAGNGGTDPSGLADCGSVTASVDSVFPNYLLEI